VPAASRTSSRLVWRTTSSSRLKKLVEEGIFDRQPYAMRQNRFEYHLTEKGRGLLPILATLRQWGQRWTDGPEASRVTHRGHDHQVSVRIFCDDCGRILNSEEIEIARTKPSPPHEP
jgi:HxlR-like helix-turn-helix